MKNRIKEIAVSHGIPLGKVAEFLGMKQKSLSKVITNKADLSLRKSMKLCELFKCDLDDLYPWKTSREEDSKEMVKQWEIVPLFVFGDNEMIFLNNEGEVISYFKEQLGENPGFQATVSKIDQIVQKVKHWNLKQKTLLCHAIIGLLAREVASG